MCRLSPAFFKLFLPDTARFSSSKEDDKNDEKDDEDQKDLDHQPAVGGDRLEIFKDLSVCGLHVELRVFNVGIDSERGRRREEVQQSRPCHILFFPLRVIFLVVSSALGIMLDEPLAYKCQERKSFKLQFSLHNLDT